jgi:hypothetical protein
VKFLGIHLDPSLTFKYHVNKTITKLSSALYALRSAKKFLNTEAKKTLYFALFQSHLVYANQIWSGAPNNLIKKIEKLQKSAMRVICNKNNSAHTEPLFKELGILRLKDLFYFFKSQFMYYYINNKTPRIFANTWTVRNRDERLRQNNHEENNLIPFYRLATLEKLPLITYPTAWRNTEDEIRKSPSIAIFNNTLKTSLLDSLSNTPICNRVLCPECSRQ